MSRKVKVWRVGGGDLLVREGESLRSSEVSGRLATGALVKQLRSANGRLCYKLLTGRGPETGWVSTHLKGRETLCDAGWATEAAPVPEPEAAADKEAADQLIAKELLCLPADATKDDINSAFRRASVKVHPDRCPEDPDAAAKFHSLMAARELLLGRCREDVAEDAPAAAPDTLPSERVAGHVWEVVGGDVAAGLLVREGRSLMSRELPQRLAPGARVEELKVDGDRFHYRKVAGDGPEVGWVSLRAKNRFQLRPPGLKQNEFMAMEYRNRNLVFHGPWLTLEQALSMQEDLLEVLSRKDFQERLWLAWAASGADPERFSVARLPIALEVQGPILTRYGFESSAGGLISSIVGYWAGEVPLNAYPEVAFKNDMLHWLTDPGKQVMSPISQGGFHAEFGRRLAAVREAAHYDLQFPGSKAWDVRALIVENGGDLRSLATLISGWGASG